MNIGNETEQIEFKKSTSEIKEGIISITGILNKHGKGTLYFGVKDDGEVVGQEIGKDTLRHISRDISGNINPNCWYEVNERRSGDGKQFIEVQFAGDAAPYSAYGRYYERFADEDKAMSNLELERLFAARKKDYSAWEISASGTGISDIDHGLFAKVMQSGCEGGRIADSGLDYQAILSKLGLISEKEGFLNNAGEVLFSKNKPVTLKLATFASNTKDTFIKLKHFEGNIYECIDEGIRYISEAVDWKVEIGADARRNEMPEIPTVAIREIVINAFAHGEYGANTTFEIDVFKDRVAIYSPGAFPLGYDPHDFADNNEEPVMLNPRIVNVLFKTGEIESFGSGFRRTFQACDRENVKYSYENTKSGFRFVFYRPLGHENVREMSKTEKAVFDEIKSNNMATAKIIAAKIGKSEKTVYRAIATLKSLGIMERQGDDYNGYWKIKE